nr:hypothetical transcript [Hymenolepis microstoma]
MGIRPECGLLSDGRAFATMHRSRDTYYLFINKYEYIYHFLAHYVNNIRKSKYVKANDFYKSVHSIIRFPRMEAVSATLEDVQTVANLIPNVEVINNPPTLALHIKGP